MQGNLTEAQQQIEQDYQQQKERRAALTNLTLRVTESQTPTPTQEENDRFALGLMHPDEKAAATAPEMPPLVAQQAYVTTGEGSLEPVTREDRRPALAARQTQPPRPPEQRPADRPADRNVPRPEPKP